MKQNLFAQNRFGFGLQLAVMLFSLASAVSLRADTIKVTGSVNQSVQDGTGPAINNPSLNSVLDGDLFTVSLTFAGSIVTPGTYALTGLSVLFTSTNRGEIENQFDSGSLIISQSAGSDVFSVLGCLSTGAGCNQGNELDLNFMISSWSLNALNVAAAPVPNLLPLDLLEDEGVTDIHGLVTTYSYLSPVAVPEPSAFVMVLPALLAVALAAVRRPSKTRSY